MRKTAWEREDLEPVARKIHEDYAQLHVSKWEEISEDFRRSNFHQAAYAENILRSVGLCVRRPDRKIELLKLEKMLTQKQIEEMAAMEHGRWNVERLMQGWRYGPEKDEKNRISPYLAPWDKVPREIQQYDIDAVMSFPEVLKEAGVEVYKPGEVDV